MGRMSERKEVVDGGASGYSVPRGLRNDVTSTAAHSLFS